MERSCVIQFYCVDEDECILTKKIVHIEGKVNEFLQLVINDSYSGLALGYRTTMSFDITYK